MKNLYYRLLNLGVHRDIPLERQSQLRITNLLELYSLLFYILYGIVSICIGSRFLPAMSLTIFLFGMMGMYMNYRRKYAIAKILIFGSFSVVLLVACNSLKNGGDFMVFYFPILVSYIIIHDFKEDLPSAVFNLFITIFCVLGYFLLPPHLFRVVTIDPRWVPFFRTLNYCVAFSVALGYMLFVSNHIGKNATKLVVALTEAERQKEAYLHEKNKAESATTAKSQFLSNMSHELRTPLNGIIGTVQLLLQEEMLPEQKQHYRVLKYSSEHMLSLINDVLDFSKIEADQMDLSVSPFNLKDSLDKLFTVFNKQYKDKNIQLSFKVNQLLDRDFLTDETRLNQVLTNLLSNALKFSKNGTVQCGATVVSANSHSADICFSVKDAGIGINAEQQENIFKAFRQAEVSTMRRFGGTGLGLFISKKIVTMLGGDLQVKSKPDMGSCFYFTLTIPFSDQKATFVNDEKVSALQSLKGIKVLMIDDSAVNRRITRRFLDRWDVEMEEASDGKEGLQLFYKKKYDLLLIDLHMPVMDGYETIAAIRKVDQAIPALAFTAALFPEMQRKLVEHGFTDFVQKPFRPEDLHRKIVMHQPQNVTV